MRPVRILLVRLSCILAVYALLFLGNALAGNVFTRPGGEEAPRASPHTFPAELLPDISAMLLFRAG